MLSALSIFSAYSLLFYFTVYSFLGWLLENSYSLVITRRFFKEGFFNGPFKPMYGFAPVLLVLLISQDTHWIIALFLCLVIPTLIEYVSGYLLHTYFHRRWWDYSNIPLQLHGHICLSFSFCWIFLSIICLRWIHPALTLIYEAINQYWIWVSPFVAVYFFAELIFSLRRHLPKYSSPTKQESPTQ